MCKSINVMKANHHRANREITPVNIVEIYFFILLYLFFSNKATTSNASRCYRNEQYRSENVITLQTNSLLYFSSSFFETTVR